MSPETALPDPAERNLMAVVRCGSGWRILTKRQQWGRFAYRVDAEEAALRLAARARAAGQATEVLVQDSAGELQRLSAEA